MCQYCVFAVSSDVSFHSHPQYPPPPQELVECSRPSGCQGGIMDEAFDWVKANGGITTEDARPDPSTGHWKGI